jgi:plastocyanin
MTRRALAAAGAALLALAASTASAQMGHDMHGDGGAGAAGTVSMLTSAYAPAHTDILIGDTLRWSNDSVRAHTVTAQSGAWSSPRVFSGESFNHRFDAAGSEPYYCTLHVFMRGVVDVHRVLLDAPKEPGAAGRPYAVRGRAALPAGSTVAIEADSGGGFQPAATATVGDHGVFSTDVIPSTTATYRAVTAEETSPAVQLLVLDRKLTASAHGRGRRTVIDAAVAPASPGATVVVQLRLRERFGWWPVARAKLDHHSRARFALRLGHRYPARVVLTLRDGATQLALSRTLRVGPR